MIRALIFFFMSIFLALPVFAAEIAPAPAPAPAAAAPAVAPSLSTLREKAESGQAAFQNYFGYLYFNGIGGLPKDYDEAFKWYHKAADQGYVPAQYGLGVMYDEGLGVEQNHEAGYFWLTLAAGKSGKPEYAERRDAAGLTLTLAEMDVLRKRAANWKPTMGNPAPVPAAASASATAVPAGAPLSPGTPTPWFRLPPPVQKTINENVGAGCMIGKVEKAIEEGVVVYRAQIDKPGSVSNVVRVTQGGKLISVSKLSP